MRTKGFTLLETVIAGAILAAVVVTIFAVLNSSSAETAAQSKRLELDRLARDTAEQIARDLREAGLSTLRTWIQIPGPAGFYPPANGTTYYDLQFGKHSGYDLKTKKVLFANTLRYRWMRDAAEIDDGLDNNGNAVADEGHVERTDPYGTVTRICPDVKEQGLKFVLNGRTVAITLELERKDRGTGVLYAARAETTVELRN
jgi:type II secretory pathway pseudopilin PulG